MSGVPGIGRGGGLYVAIRAIEGLARFFGAQSVTAPREEHIIGLDGDA